MTRSCEFRLTEKEARERGLYIAEINLQEDVLFCEIMLNYFLDFAGCGRCPDNVRNEEDCDIAFQMWKNSKRS